VNSLLILGIVVALTLGFGFWHKSTRGKVRGNSYGGTPALTAEELGSAFGSRVTLVQFSSAFCSPCRATKTLLSNIVEDLPDVVHIDIDAESHLALVRRLKIISTPTTLILDRHGVEIARAVGVPKRDQVLASLAAIL
jgi:thiol-disulfide isomerase/thioredoxin